MLNLLKFKRRGTAPVARERLQVLLAHERAFAGQSDLVAVLREQIIAVIVKHIKIKHLSVEPDRVQVRTNHGTAVSTLKIDIEIPAPTEAQDPVRG